MATEKENQERVATLLNKVNNEYLRLQNICSKDLSVLMRSERLKTYMICGQKPTLEEILALKAMAKKINSPSLRHSISLNLVEVLMHQTHFKRVGSNKKQRLKK